MSITVYKTKKGKAIYLTGNKIAGLLRKAGRPSKRYAPTLLQTNSRSSLLIP
jgi:hypothetical protein